MEALAWKKRFAFGECVGRSLTAATIIRGKSELLTFRSWILMHMINRPQEEKKIIFPTFWPQNGRCQSQKRMGRYIEEYRNFNENPAWTADGFPITHSVEDACPHGEWESLSRCNDCGTCRFYNPVAPNTRIGVCRQEKRLWANKKRRLEDEK